MDNPCICNMILKLTSLLSSTTFPRFGLSGPLRLFSSLHLGNLSPAAGSNEPKKRVGRGRAAGGRFCGRGAAGQNSRSGPGLPRGFAGGQTPLHISTPKYGFVNALEKEFSLINLGRLQNLIDAGRLDTSKPITMKSLHDAGIENLQDGVKILASGKEFFKSKVFIQATRFSKEAIARIEELGGTAVSVHHTELGLRALTRPERFIEKGRLVPRFAAPVSRKDRLYYSNPENRGYLLPDNWQKCAESDPEFAQKYVKIDPLPIPEKPVTFKEFMEQKQ